VHRSVALQHGIVALHDCAVFAHVGGGSVSGGATHRPDVSPGLMSHVVGEQQSAPKVQLAPAGWHAVACSVLHLWVAASQSAEQQSAAESHVPPFGAHPPQTIPSKQKPVQHVPVAQLWPTSLQPFTGVVSRHSFRDVPGTVRQDSPPVWPFRQQSASTVHAPPRGVHCEPPGGVVSAHLSTPPASGTHGTPLQH
jgi:hypothetical protein